MRKVFSEIFAFFGTLTPEGVVAELSGTVFEKVRVDPNLLVGQSLAETVFWQTSESNAAILADAIRNARQGRAGDILLDFRISAFEKMGMEFRLIPVFDEAQHLTRIFFCATEVSARDKEVAFYKERSEHLLYAAENAEIGLWSWDLVRDTIYSTPKCNEFFEVPPDGTITFAYFLEKLHPADRPQVEKALDDSRLSGGEYRSNYRVVRKNGEVQWITARGRTFLGPDGTPREMMGMVQKMSPVDVTGVRSGAAEPEARRGDESPEAKARDSFLAVVSHELRSPLNAILGWTKILLKKEVDDDTRIKALETIEKSARSQAKLLDDLLDSSRVASGRIKLEFRETDLREIVGTVVNLQKPSADAKKIALDLADGGEPIFIFGDTIRLQQVISNLLSNSLKFTPDGGKIAISLEKRPQTAVIRVVDTGRGISRGAITEIFKQFTQGDEDSPGTFGGLGLGLSIAKILVEKHRGTITAESEGPGKGSAFTVTLPLLAEPSVKPAENERTDDCANQPLAELKILIIEDEPASREALRLFLEENGASVMAARSAENAFAMLADVGSGLPDAIISDLAMPGIDGYSFLTRLRQMPREKGGSIPALALSAFTTDESRRKAIGAGFQKYHTKPFEAERLIRQIQEITSIPS